MKHYYEYERRLSPAKAPDYFVWGGFVHYAKEIVFHAGGWQAYAEKRDEVVEKIQTSLRGKVEARAKIKPLPPYVLLQYEGFILLLPYVMDAYLFHYKDSWSRYEIAESERKFSVSLGLENEAKEGEGWTFEGKIDEIVRDTTTGVFYIWDTKTPGAISADYGARLALDSQLKGYCVGSQRGIGVPVLHAIHDVMQKPPKQKDKKFRCEDPKAWAEIVGTQYLVNHEKLFQRFVQEYTQEQIDAYYVELCLLAKTIAWHQKEGIWTMHHPGNRIGHCPYFDLCVNGESTALMDNFYERPLENYNNEFSEDE